MSEPIIQFIDVHKSFETQNGETQRVLKGVNFGIMPGMTTVIGGGSGQGKSVAIKLVLGLMQPDSGQILVEGKDITKMDRQELSEVRKNFGVLFQSVALFDSLTVFENVALPLREKTKQNKKEIHEKVTSTLAQFELQGHEEKFPAQLSGGMQKRVGIARAIALNPKYLFCDEPNSGLDPQTSIVIDNLISDITAEFDITTVTVTHDMNSVMEEGDSILFIYEGKKWWTGDKVSILKSDNQELNDFVYASRIMKRVKG